MFEACFVFSPVLAGRDSHTFRPTGYSGHMSGDRLLRYSALEVGNSELVALLLEATASIVDKLGFVTVIDLVIDLADVLRHTPEALDHVMPGLGHRQKLRRLLGLPALPETSCATVEQTPTTAERVNACDESPPDSHARTPLLENTMTERVCRKASHVASEAVTAEDILMQSGHGTSVLPADPQPRARFCSDIRLLLDSFRDRLYRTANDVLRARSLPQESQVLIVQQTTAQLQSIVHESVSALQLAIQDAHMDTDPDQLRSLVTDLNGVVLRVLRFTPPWHDVQPVEELMSGHTRLLFEQLDRWQTMSKERVNDLHAGSRCLVETCVRQSDGIRTTSDGAHLHFDRGARIRECAGGAALSVGQHASHVPTADRN